MFATGNRTSNRWEPRVSEHQDDRDQLAKTFPRKVIVSHKSGADLWTVLNHRQKVPALAVIEVDNRQLHVCFLCNQDELPKDVTIALLRELADKLENT